MARFDQQAQALVAREGVGLRLPEGGDIHERDHHAFDPIVQRAVRQDAHQVEPALCVRTSRSIVCKSVEHLRGVGVEPIVREPAGDVRQRAADVGRQQVEDLLRA